MRVLEIDSLDKVQRLVQRYKELQVPKEHEQVFLRTLTQDRQSWFLEVGDSGLVYFTNVVPRLGAQINVLFWDGKLSKNRVSTVRQAVRQAFETFALERVSAQFKWSNVPLKRFLKDVGFVYEGTLRKGWLEPDGLHDMLLFGIISEEL